MAEGQQVSTIEDESTDKNELLNSEKTSGHGGVKHGKKDEQICLREDNFWLTWTLSIPEGRLDVDLDLDFAMFFFLLFLLVDGHIPLCQDGVGPLQRCLRHHQAEQIGGLSLKVSH